ncbi:MAG TPA: MurR/RpiR family transcriptional regulator [Chloroflexi bacterium]|jgi:DNA-binding MurR/RpiR family transcriptional regulator|nr:MurR/RpiR family transcriptional regulator [Chloroflexota bacterium]
MVLEKIRQIYPKLTKSQKRLADYIAVSYQEAAFMTASRLARTLLVNEATVIRFAQRLGYPGYPELVHDIQELVQGELRARSQEEASTNGDEAFLAALDTELDTLQRAVGRITPEVARAVTGLLCNAERIVVVGEGISGALAGVMSASLRTLGVPAENPPADPLGLAVALEEAAPGWVVVGISVIGESWPVANALQYACERGARTLALAWSPVAPAAQSAELALCCPTNELQAPPVAVIATMMDALVQMVATQRAEAMPERQERLSQLRAYLGTQRA